MTNHKRLLLAVLLIPGLLQFTAGSANAAPFKPPALQKIAPVPVTSIAKAMAPIRRAEQDKVINPENAVLPSAGMADPPVSLSGGRQGRVEMLGKTMLPGVVFRVTGAGNGAVGVKLDYTKFGNAYGGNWGSRLRLVQLPECALTTPEHTDCQPTPLKSENDGRSVSATAPSAGTLLAALAAPSGSAGTYKASDLSPTSTWGAGGNTGGFTWSYPISAPPVPGGLTPSVGLAYSSSSVDGKTVSANIQASWVGEGFSFWPGYIERRYKSCADDGIANSGNQCWETDNATLSLNGGGGELLKASDGKWYNRAADGSRIELLTGASNGDDNGEYWLVTTPDGTKYYFGQSAAWTMPVLGNELNEPCYPAFCTQGWRWNLEKVVDRNGNIMTYSYTQEKNRYAKKADGTDTVEYVRGGTLDKIEYGLRSSGAAAPARIVFDSVDRCSTATNCDPSVVDNRKNWLETPWDQSCTSTTSCPGLISPTFWNRKRLSKITTQVRTGSTYRNVDSFVLNHTYRKTYPTNNVLWLDTIVRTGHTNGDLIMPAVRFDGLAMPNRADSLIDGVSPMNRFRVTDVFTETGGQIHVDYSAPECIPGTNMPLAEDNNSLLCMPVRWQPDGQPKPILDWFHNYVVRTVTESDRTAGAQSSQHIYTKYEYVGTPAWHSDDDNGLVADKFKTYAQFRGYAEVRVHKGDPVEEQITSTRYFRGLHGDKRKDGTTRSVQVDGFDDLDYYAGLTRETVTWNGTAKVSAILSDPWRSDPPLATRTINGSVVDSRYTGVGRQRTETVLENGRASRFAATNTTFDEHGLVKQVNDEGQVGLAGDEQCTITKYAKDIGNWLIGYPSSVDVVAKPCGTAAASEADMISASRTFYDGLGIDVAPTKGNITRQELMSAWSATGNHSWIPTSRDTFDEYGRITKHTDALGSYVASTYTHNADGQLSSTNIKNILFQNTTTQLDVARGVTLSEVDGNGKRTDLEYDALGRLTGVWRLGRAKPDLPNFAYEYHINSSAPSVVVTKSLNPAGGQITAYELYDGLMRMRQSQSPAPGVDGGRTISETFYDTAGRERLRFDKYYATGDPNGSLVTASAVNVERQSATIYDKAGRVIESVMQPKGTPKWKSTTGYGGDRIYTVPPDGGIATTSISDVAGRVVELRQHHQRNTSSTFDATAYTRNARGDLLAVKDTLGNQWRYEIDLRGRVWRTTDPDQGVSTATFDDLDHMLSYTDARGVKLVSTYDKLGRKYLSEQDIAGVKTKLAEWKYDTAPNGKGRLASATRYVGGNAYTTSITEYNDAGQPLGTKITIPSSEGLLAGEYEFTSTFNADGSPATRSIPGVAGEMSETLQYGYDKFGSQVTLTGNLPDTPRYVAAAKYSEYGNLLQADLSTKVANGTVYRSFTYESDTGRPATATTSRDSVSPNYVSINTFNFDAAGNLKRLAESQSGDTQCFRYDYLRRMEHAWTPASGSDCTADPSVSGLAGPAKYWHTYAFDATGNRKSETQHGAAGDTVANYTYGSAKPHFLTEVKTKVPGVAERTDTFDHNEIGAMKSRTVSGVAQTITWDPEGRVAKVTQNGKESSYLYDTDGNRLIARDSKDTTLYLGNGLELRLDKASGALASTKYYSFGPMNIAVRKAGKLTWLANDHHDTGELSINDGTQALTRRYSLPFGGSRGTAPSSWVTDKGFVGGTKDETGLTHLGARLYDPGLGRFISVDPVIENTDPQQLNGYSYSNNAPGTFSDADGRSWRSVFNVAKAAVNAQINVVKSVAKFAYDNAGAISAVAGVLALVPVLAPVMGPVSLVFGAIDAIKNCSEGAVVDCAIGVVSAVPGVRLLAAGAKVSKAIKPAKQALDKADDAVAAAEKNLAKYGDSRPRNPHKRAARSQARDELEDTKEAQAAAQRRFDDVKGKDREADLGDGWYIADKTSFGVGLGVESCKQQGKLTGAVCADPSLHATVGLKPLYGKDWNGGFKGTGYLNRPLFNVPSGNSPIPTFTTVLSTEANKKLNDMYDQKRKYMEDRYGL